MGQHSHTRRKIYIQYFFFRLIYLLFRSAVNATYRDHMAGITMHGNHPAGLQIRTKVFNGISVEWINRFCFFILLLLLLLFRTGTNKHAKCVLLLAQLNSSFAGSQLGSLRAQHTSNQNPTLCPIYIIRMARVFTFFFPSACLLLLVDFVFSMFIIRILCPKCVSVCVCLTRQWIHTFLLSIVDGIYGCIGGKRFIIILAFMENFLLIRVSFKPIAEHTPTDMPAPAHSHVCIINERFSIALRWWI